MSQIPTSPFAYNNARSSHLSAGLRLALYCRHMVSLSLMTHNSQTSLELQSGLYITLISKAAGLRSSFLRSVCLHSQFERKNICVKFEDIFLLIPSQERVIIGVAYDCVEKVVYWTDITSPSISKASIQGGEPAAVIRAGRFTFTLRISL